MRWDELDFENGWWTIAAARAKNRLSHRVPLEPQSIAILRGLKPAGDATGDIFPGGKRGLALTNLQKPTFGSRRPRASISAFTISGARPRRT
jgi:integrase